jgi:purine-binding chemotaxis protein CheW
MRHRPDRFDWDALKHRLADVDAALAGARQPTPDQADRILAARARALAVPAQAVRVEPTIALLTFSIDGEVHGVPTADVLEVCRLTHLALLPRARPPVFGVTAWRGELLVTFDLARTPRAAAAPWLVALRAGEARFGLVADAVHDIVEVVSASLHVPAASAPPYIRAVTGDAMVVLDAAPLGRRYR